MVTRAKSSGRRGSKNKGAKSSSKLEIPVVQIGEKIRALRKKNGHSIQKLSELSGVSPAGIYKIETNGMVPTITTLVKLATALERRVSYFVEEEDSQNAFRLIRKSERKIVASGQEGRTEVVADRLRRGRIEATYRTLESGSKTKNPLVNSDCEYLIYCLRGELGVIRGDDKHQLKEGDSFHFEANDRVHFENKGRSEARFLIVNSNLSVV